MAICLLLFFWAMASITVAIFIGKIWWLPELISVHGKAIDDQLVLTLIVAGVAFFLAQIGLGYAIWKFRGRGAERAEHWHENPRMEVFWTTVTAIVFIALAIQGDRIWAHYILTPVPTDALTVEVT